MRGIHRWPVNSPHKWPVMPPRFWPCAGNSPVTGEFPAQMASNAENVSIWWRHYAKRTDVLPCNHSLYIGIFMFPHIDNPQSTGHNLLQEKIYQKRNTKKWGHPSSWLVIGDGNSTSVYIYSKYLTRSLDWNRATDCNNKPTKRK